MKRINFVNFNNELFKDQNFLRTLIVRTRVMPSSLEEFLSEVYGGDLGSVHVKENQKSVDTKENESSEAGDLDSKVEAMKNANDKEDRKKHHKYVVFTKSLIKEFKAFKNFVIVFKFSS